MKRTVLTAPYVFEAEDVPMPQPSEGEVLLKIRNFGICGSDIQMYHGLHKYMTFPVVIGHEAAATVVQTGKGVTDYAVGDNVTIEPQVFCTECYPCRSGRFNVCENLRVMGVHIDGFAAQYAAVGAKYLHRCDGLSDDQTALIEPLAVGFGAVKRAGDLHGKKVVVVGAGTIGNLTAQAAQAMGAKLVMVTDVKQKKLDYAAKCGIKCCVNTTGRDLKEVIVENFGSDKADVIIDCAATRGALLSILAAARPNSQIIITGNYKVPVEIELPILQRQEISLIGHMMYVREDFADAIRGVQEGRIRLEGFATQHYAIEKLAEAFKFIDENPDDYMKVMITIE
jgi:L-iditol 2-dehydrogenase